MKFFIKNWRLFLSLAAGIYIATMENDLPFVGILVVGLFVGIFIFVMIVLFFGVTLWIPPSIKLPEIPEPEEAERIRKEFNKLDLGGYISPKEDREFRKEQAEIKRRNRDTNSGFGGFGGIGGL